MTRRLLKPHGRPRQSRYCHRTILSKRLAYAIDHIGERPNLTFTYFIPDNQKEGGRYVSTSGILRAYDDFEKKIALEDGTVILIETIISISGDMLDKFNLEK